MGFLFMFVWMLFYPYDKCKIWKIFISKPIQRENKYFLYDFCFSYISCRYETFTKESEIQKQSDEHLM